MPYQQWAAMLNGAPPWQVASGAALTAASTSATISPQQPWTAAGTGLDMTVPANYWWVGQTLRIYASGYITTTATSCNWTVQIAANKAGAYTVMAATAAIATGTTVATGLPWWLTGFITCIGIGSTGNTLQTQGRLFVQSTTAQPSLSGTSNIVHYGLPSASGVTNAAVDTSSPQAIVLRSFLSGANATVQCTGFDLEAWN